MMLWETAWRIPIKKFWVSLRECTRKNLSLMTHEEIAETPAVRVQSKDLLFLEQSCAAFRAR